MPREPLPDWLHKLRQVLRFLYGSLNLGFLHCMFQDLMTCGTMGLLIYKVAPIVLRLVGASDMGVAFAHDFVVGGSLIAWVAKVIVRLARWIGRKR